MSTELAHVVSLLNQYLRFDNPLIGPYQSIRLLPNKSATSHRVIRLTWLNLLNHQNVRLDILVSVNPHCKLTETRCDEPDFPLQTLNQWIGQSSTQTLPLLRSVEILLHKINQAIKHSNNQEIDQFEPWKNRQSALRYIRARLFNQSNNQTSSQITNEVVELDLKLCLLHAAMIRQSLTIPFPSCFQSTVQSTEQSEDQPNNPGNQIDENTNPNHANNQPNHQSLDQSIKPGNNHSTIQLSKQSTKQSVDPVERLEQALNQLPPLTSISPSVNNSAANQSAHRSLDQLPDDVLALLSQQLWSHLSLKRVPVNHLLYQSSKQSATQQTNHTNRLPDYQFDLVNLHDPVHESAERLIGFHGSPLCNWYSILHTGLQSSQSINQSAPQTINQPSSHIVDDADEPLDDQTTNETSNQPIQRSVNKAIKKTNNQTSSQSIKRTNGAIFGEGIYLAADLTVARMFSSINQTRNQSILSSTQSSNQHVTQSTKKLEVVGVFEIVYDPEGVKLVNDQSNDQPSSRSSNPSINESTYYVVSDGSLIRLKSLLVWVDQSAAHTVSQSAKLIMFYVLLLLLVIVFSNNQSIHQSIKPVRKMLGKWMKQSLRQYVD